MAPELTIVIVPTRKLVMPQAVRRPWYQHFLVWQKIPLEMKPMPETRKNSPEYVAPRCDTKADRTLTVFDAQQPIRVFLDSGRLEMLLFQGQKNTKIAYSRPTVNHVACLFRGFRCYDQFWSVHPSVNCLFSGATLKRTIAYKWAKAVRVEIVKSRKRYTLDLTPRHSLAIDCNVYR